MTFVGRSEIFCNQQGEIKANDTFENENIT